MKKCRICGKIIIRIGKAPDWLPEDICLPCLNKLAQERHDLFDGIDDKVKVN